MHGKFSKNMPQHLAERVAELMEDPELMDLTADVAVLTAMAEDELAAMTMGTAERVQLWQEARKLFKRAAEEGDAEALVKLGTLLETGAEDAVRTGRAVDLMERRAKMAVAHRRMLRDQNMMLPLTELRVFVLRLNVLLADKLEAQPELLAGIGAEIEKLWDGSLA